MSMTGFLAMSDFLERFGENGKFSAFRQGTIVALLCAGTLVGCLSSGWVCDKIGRRYTISASAFFYIIGVVIEITSSRGWVQFAMGRFAAGLGIGALSTSVPMYQSESVPKNIRGAIVASYQLLITLGIWTAYMVIFHYSVILHPVANICLGKLGYRGILFKLGAMADSECPICALGCHTWDRYSLHARVASFCIPPREDR
jgi:MFS family permease